MMSWPEESIPCRDPNAFTVTRAKSWSAVPRLKGRKVGEIKDAFPPLIVTVAFDMSLNQYTQFLSFWTSTCAQGDAFLMDVWTPSGFVSHICTATRPFSANMSPNMRYTVRIDLETVPA